MSCQFMDSLFEDCIENNLQVPLIVDLGSIQQNAVASWNKQQVSGFYNQGQRLSHSGRVHAL